MNAKTMNRLLILLSFAALVAVSLAFKSNTEVSNYLAADTSTMFTDYYFPDPKRKDGKKQFVKKLCLKSEKVVEKRIKDIIDAFKNDKGYKKNKIGKNPDVGWHRKTDELIFRNAEDHKKTYAPKLKKDAAEGAGVKISTFGDCG